MSQILFQLALVEESFLGLKWPRIKNPDLLSIGPIYTEDAYSTCRGAKIEKPGLNRKAWGIRQQPDRKGVLKRFLNFLQRQRAIQIEGRIIPIKLHIRCSIVYVTPMQCNYIVFTHGVREVSTGIVRKTRKNRLFEPAKPVFRV